MKFEHSVCLESLMTTYDSLVDLCKNVCSVKYVVLSTFVLKTSLFYFYDAVQNTAKLQQNYFLKETVTYYIRILKSQEQNEEKLS